MGKLRVCSGCGAAGPKFQCPTCRQQGSTSGFFCTQTCFKEHWREHKAIHATSANVAPSQATPTTETVKPVQQLAAEEAELKAAEGAARAAAAMEVLKQVKTNIRAALSGAKHTLITGLAEPSSTTIEAVAWHVNHVLFKSKSALVIGTNAQHVVQAYAHVRSKLSPGLRQWKTGHLIVGQKPSIQLRKVAAESRFLAITSRAFALLAPKPRNSYSLVVMYGKELNPANFTSICEPDAIFVLVTSSTDMENVMPTPFTTVPGLNEDVTGEEDADDKEDGDQMEVDDEDPKLKFAACDDMLTRIILQELNGEAAAKYILEAVPKLKTATLRQSLRCVAMAKSAQDPEQYAHSLLLSLLMGMCDISPSEKYGKCAPGVMSLACAIHHVLQAYPISDKKPNTRGRWFFYAVLAYIYKKVEPNVVDQLAKVLGVMWLVQPEMRESSGVKYGQHGLLYDCTRAVLQIALKYLSVGGDRQEKIMGDLHGGSIKILMQELCWDQFLQRHIGPHKRFLQQESSTFYPQCPPGGDKFNDGSLRVFGTVAFPTYTTFPICTKQSEARKELVQQAIQELLLLMPRGDGTMLLGDLGSYIGSWSTFRTKYDADLGPSLTYFLRRHREHFTLCGDDRLIRRTVEAPDHVQVIPSLKYHEDDRDKDDDRDKNTRTKGRQKGRMAKVKTARMDVLARRVKRKIRISRVRKRKTAPARKKGRGIVPRRKVF